MDANVQVNDWMKRDEPKIAYIGQLGILIGFVFVGLLLAGIVQVVTLLTIIPFKDFAKYLDKSDELMAILAKPENFSKAVLMQGLSTFLLFALPAYFLARIVSKNPFTTLGFSSKFNLKSIGLVVAIAIVGLLLSGGLGEFTKILPMGTWLKNKALQMEETYEKGVMMFVNMKTFGDYIFSLFMIAILPAFFEEILFRGCIQNILTKWFKEHHISIIITGFIFSLVHISIMGFLSRMMLGMVLGYVFHYSKNLWLSILMHFINNGVAVTAMYIAIKKGSSIEESMKDTFPIWLGVVALVLMIGLLVVYRKNCEAVERQEAIGH